MNSLYEAALYVFVFLWTPALERRAALGEPAQGMGHGLVFSVFMLSKMAGSQGFHFLSSRLSPASILQLVFAGSACCLAAPLLTQSYERTLLAFCGFEALLGMCAPRAVLERPPRRRLAAASAHRLRTASAPPPLTSRRSVAACAVQVLACDRAPALRRARRRAARLDDGRLSRPA